MPTVNLKQELLKLPAHEREELIETLWLSLEEEISTIPDWQRELIDERLEELENNDHKFIDWVEVKEKIWPLNK